MRKKVNIHIGEYHASANPTIIQTVLGSCVAVCLFDPRNLIGGMNHILLPGKADLARFDVSARYGVNAMELLINRMMNLGADRKRLQAKVFGGAHMLAGISRENGVGDKISQFVLEFLDVENIKIVNSDLGGTDSRKILLYTDTGDVFLKRVLSTYQSRIATKEKLAARLVKDIAEKPGEVTIFQE
ncbi:chemotaxis protein CheD [Desulfonatronospira sp.]|uniref:chemotaxis protein CheD n=1 Tax=Desulfonatronospira sp. TaxID=1962951 RepID=UPI0025C00847|nr:chemotaxis protein CheD [Desulfonatronospira sp.]